MIPDREQCLKYLKLLANVSFVLWRTFARSLGRCLKRWHMIHVVARTFNKERQGASRERQQSRKPSRDETFDWQG